MVAFNINDEQIRRGLLRRKIEYMHGQGREGGPGRTLGGGGGQEGTDLERVDEMAETTWRRIRGQS